MATPLVSVIIPVYNVASYLCRCVDSVLVQSYSNLQIILVDDGSPDLCPKICDNYSRADSRVFVIHKENGGLASARNAGMRIARGEYILFVDSDDWIDPETIEELVSVAEKHDVDFVRFRPMYANWPNHPDGTMCDFGTEQGMHEGLFDRNDIIETIYPRLFATPQLTLGVFVAAWRSLYRRKFLTENNIWFYDEIRYSEDTIFSAKVLLATQRFYYLDGGKYYHYYFNPTSITKSFRSDRWNSCKQLMAAFDRDFSNISEYDFSKQLCLQKMYCVMSALGQRNLISDYNQRLAYCRDICNDYETIQAFQHLHLVHVPWKLKILMKLVRLRAAKLLAII